MRALPIDEGVAILGRIVATSDRDATSLHLRVVRALDVFASHGLVIAPERIVPRVAAALRDDSVLDLMVTVLVESERVASALVSRVRGFEGLREEALHAYGVRRVLIDPAAAIDRYLPRDVVLQNDFRREELLRAWAARAGVPVEREGKLEEPERSARLLQRLDYRRIRADEERLAIEQRVLSEHAELVREKQRQAEAAALASAQRE